MAQGLCSASKCWNSGEPLRSIAEARPYQSHGEDITGVGKFTKGEEGKKVSLAFPSLPPYFITIISPISQCRWNQCI
jgi:hypothetical protein